MMLMKNFEVERSFIVAEQVGLAQAALEDAAKYANQRIAFGKPITKLQMIQEKLCDMEIKVQNTRNMLYKTLWKLDNGESVQLRLRDAEALWLLRVLPGRRHGALHLRRFGLYYRSPHWPHLGRPARQHVWRWHPRSHGLHCRPPGCQEVRQLVSHA